MYCNPSFLFLALSQIAHSNARAAEIAAAISIDVEFKAQVRVGGAIKIDWKSDKSAPLEIPLYLVVAASSESRFAGTGFVALNKDSKGLYGIHYEDNRVRAFVPLYRDADARGGQVSVVPYRSGLQKIDWAVVTTDSCGEQLLNKGNASRQVVAGPVEIFALDRFTNERPLKRVLSPNGVHELLAFKDRYEVFEIASHTRVLNRPGTDPNFSPTGRFIAARGEGRIFDLWSGKSVNTQGLGHDFLAWVRGDSFAIVGSMGWESVTVISTLADDRQPLEVPTMCGLCRAFDITLTLDVDKGFLVTNSDYWRVGDLATWQVYPADLAKYDQLVAQDKSEEAGKIFDAAYERWSNPEGTLDLIKKRYDPNFTLPTSDWRLGEPLVMSHIQTENFRDAADQRMQENALHRSRSLAAPAAERERHNLRGLVQSSRGLEVAGRVVIPNAGIQQASFSAKAFERLKSIGVSTLPILPTSLIAERPNKSGSEARFTRTIESIIGEIMSARPPGFRISVPANSTAGRCETEDWDSGERIRYSRVWKWRDGGRNYWLLYANCVDGSTHVSVGQLALGRAGIQGPLSDLFPAFAAGKSESKVENEPRYSLGYGIKTFRPAEGLLFVVFADEAYLLSLPNGKRIAEISSLTEPDLIEELRLTSDQRHLVQLNRDGRLFFYRVVDGRNVLSGAYVDDEIVIARSDGLYDSTFDGAQSVQVRFPGIAGLHYFNQFEKLLHYAGLGPEVLSDAPIGRAPIVNAPPSAQLTLETGVIDGNRTAVVASTAELGLSEVRLYVDGRLSKTVPTSGYESTIKFDFSDPGGGRWVNAVAVDSAGVLSLPSAIRIPGPPKARGILRAVLIGVNTYTDTRLAKLDFAESDAARLGEVLRSRKGFLVNEVSTKLLAGPGLDGTKLVSEIELAAAATTADDTLLLFYSGHGVDGAQFGRPELGWLLPTAGTQLERIGETAVPWSAITTALSKARGTVVVVLDACHSGSAGDSVFATNDDLVNDLARRAGPLLVLAAAKGRQSSYEDPRLRAGVFSFALAQAILGSADGSAAVSKQPVDVVEAYRVIKSSVLKREQGRQTPWLVRNALVGDLSLF